jgi:hypothetical protein
LAPARVVEAVATIRKAAVLEHTPEDTLVEMARPNPATAANKIAGISDEARLFSKDSLV